MFNYYQASPQELAEMAQDLEQQQQEIAEALDCLEALRRGQQLVIPCDVEHARAMFKLSAFYLSQHDPDFGLTTVL